MYKERIAGLEDQVKEYAASSLVAGAQPQLQGEDVQGEDCWTRGSGKGVCS
jgi:hypothetical protein